MNEAKLNRVVFPLVSTYHPIMSPLLVCILKNSGIEISGDHQHGDNIIIFFSFALISTLERPDQAVSSTIFRK